MRDWRDDAACLGEDPEAFFPVGIETEGDLKTNEAKAFCRAFCSVRSECLTWALERGINDGVWGGTTPRERRGMSRILAEQFPPVAELERERPAMRRCQDCPAEFAPRIANQRLCERCGAHHPNQRVRRRYAEVAKR